MKLKKIAAALMALMLCGLIFAAPAYADTATPNGASVPAGDSEKNETVYAMLGYDGSVSDIYVVNQLLGDYTDYGSYTSIKNLSTMSEPIVEGDRITFPDANVDGGLYYQGTMEGELPMTFSLTYYMNGGAVDAGSLGGSSGHLKIEIDCAQNEKCDARVREGLIAQIMLSLDLSLAQNVVADGATTVITGNTMSIGFAVLPGQSGSFTVEADVTDFEMDAISVTLAQGSLGGYEDSISEYEDGFDDMLSGADDMVDGTAELKDGMATLADGMGDLSYGLGRL
jgi:X-X-X-Leu-X-X-Gly heptad repeat protein